MNIIQIIILDWNILKEALLKINIWSIEIFMNLIFKKLSKLIKECKCLKTDLERNNFENQVEKLIQQNIKD